jgi:hypothetical protein
MRGIFSSAPAPSSVRLLVGNQMLLLVQAGLVLSGRSAPHGPASTLLLLTIVISLAALITAILGEPDDTPHARAEPHHDA